jgi:hypothetical protein
MRRILMRLCTAVFIMGLFITLTACQSDSVRLRNPQTAQIAQCGPYGAMSLQTAAAERELYQ